MVLTLSARIVGQMPYDSRITGRQEHRPIGSTLVGAKGKTVSRFHIFLCTAYPD